MTPPRDRYPQWFCFQRERGDDGGLYYGFPVLSHTADGRPRIKAGIDWAPKELRVAEPNAMCSEAPARLVELLDTFLFNELDGVQERVETVMSPYSMTSDVNFVLDRLTPKLSLFAGGSGQAFKFAPLVGDSLARLACGESPAGPLLESSARAGAPARPSPFSSSLHVFSERLQSRRRFSSSGPWGKPPL